VKYLFWTSYAVLATVPLYFVWNQVYRDGIFGRAALLLISFLALVTLLEPIFYDDYSFTVSNRTIMMLTAFATFLVWHLYRFHTRVDKVRRGCSKFRPECERRNVPDRRFRRDECRFGSNHKESIL